MGQTKQMKATALRLWNLLSVERQQELLQEVERRTIGPGDVHVILFDTSGKEPTVSVANYLFGVDISFEAMNAYLFVADIPKEEKND